MTISLVNAPYATRDAYQYIVFVATGAHTQKQLRYSNRTVTLMVHSPKYSNTRVTKRQLSYN